MKSSFMNARRIFFIVLVVVLLAGLGTLSAAAQDASYTLAITAGDNQSAVIGSAFASPLQVTVTDGTGAGVAGAAVTFTAPATGPTAFWISSSTQTTDASGVASISAIAINEAGGPYEVVASFEGQSVAFHLTNTHAPNPDARDSGWVEDPLDPGHPAPAEGTDPGTAVEGWWWRDTTSQNALAQHSADEYTDQVIPVYKSSSSGLQVWVYSSPVGPNVVLLMTPHHFMTVGCGGGEAEALRARNKFIQNVPGFATKTNQGAILLNARPESYWGCKKWVPTRIYASDHLTTSVVEYSNLQTERDRRLAWTYGRNLAWGPDGMLGAGMMKQYNPTVPASRLPTISIYDRTEIWLEGISIWLIPQNQSVDSLIIQIVIDGNGTLVIAGETTASFLSDPASMVYHNQPIQGWIDALFNLKIGASYANPFRYLVQMYGLPIVGTDAVHDYVTAQHDALQSLKDQTLALINQGYSIDEIAAQVSLPEALASHPANREFVANTYAIVRQVYREYVGWFGGETDELASSLTPADKAQILADAYGGLDKLAAAAKQAELDARDLAGAEKALYLAHAAYELAPQDFAVKQIYAQVLRKNAFLQKSATTRNYYLSEAQSLGTEQAVSDISKTGTEDTALAFTGLEFSQHFNGIGGAVLNTVKIVSLPENGALTLAGTDEGGSPILVPVTAGQEIPLADLDGLVFTPVKDWNGATSFLWNGKDGSGYATNDASVNIVLEPVNDPPVVSATPLADVTVDEDAAPSTIDLSTGFSDVDFLTNVDTLAYAVTSDNPAVSASVNGTDLTLTYQANWNGQATITVTATDAAGASVTDDFTVTVNPINDAPTTQDATITVVAGKSQTILLDYSDLETAQGNLAVTFGTLNGTLDASALPSLTYTAPTTAGDDSFTYTITDRGDPDSCSAAPCAAPVFVTAIVDVTVLPAPSGSISGAVFNDANANGTLDAGESGLAGVVVQLQDASGTQLETFTTGADGAYTFTGLAAGSYKVYAPKDDNRVQTTQNPIAVTLAEAQAVTGVNIGSVVSADLKVSMTASINNKAIIYTITVTNDGPADALSAALTDVLPDTVAFVSVISTQGTCSGGKTVTCSLGNLANGASATVTLKVNRVSKSPIDNTATVTSSIFDIITSNNTVTARVE